MKASLGEKIFWTAVAISSVGVGAYGYQRFKLIRPDLFGNGDTTGVSEAERAARIADYQKKGDALSRAASTRPLRRGETCVDGFIVTVVPNDASASNASAAKRVIENGQPARCDMSK